MPDDKGHAPSPDACGVDLPPAGRGQAAAPFVYFCGGVAGQLLMSVS